MAKELPIVHKAFLATKIVSSSFFLLTERTDSKTGDNFLFYMIETSHEKNGQKIQQQIHNNLTKKILASDYYSLPQFESSLQNLNASLDGLKILSSSSDMVNVLIGFCESNILHLSMTGSVEGYLLRKGKINSLTDGLNTNEEFGFHNITSGELSIQDIVIIGNKSFFDRLSLDRIRKTVNIYSPKLAIKEFFQHLRKSKYFNCNAIVIQATNTQHDHKEDENLPDLLYLDTIEETVLQNIQKKTAPIVKNILNILSKTFTSISSYSSKFAGKATEKWQKDYAPKAKEIIIKTNDKTQKGIKNISEKISNTPNNVIKKKTLKIKSYDKSRQLISKPIVKYMSKIKNIFFTICKKNNRKYFYATLIIILIIVAYGKIVSNNKNRNAIKKQNDTVYSVDKASEILKLAQEDILLGKSNGLDKLNEALNLTNIAIDNPSTHDKALEIKKQIFEEMDKTTSTKRFYDIKPIFSFKNEIVISAVSGSVIYGITIDGKIYSTDARDKDPKLLSAIESSMGVPVSACYSDSTNLLYVLTNKPTVWAYDPLSQSGAELTISDDSKWENGTSISVYSTNLYILDSSAGKIWRHSKNGNNFNAGTSFAGAKNTDAKDGISLAIDGSAYVLKTNGTVSKFSHGALDSTFNISSPPAPNNTISKPSQIYTDSDSQNIFISDLSLNRILRFAKAGEFVDQYIIENKEISNILVNPRVQKLWVVSKKDVFEIDL